jgi:hypothetical protein
VTPSDQQGGGTLSPRIVPALERVPGVGVASSLTQGDIRRNGRHGGIDSGLYGVQPATLGKVYKVTWVSGNDSDLTGLNNNGVLLEKGEATSLHVKVGDRVRLLSNARETATVTVRGIYKDEQLISNGMITTSLLQRLTNVNGVQIVLATVDGGSNPEQVAKLANDRLAAQFPTAELQSNAEFKKSIADQVNTLLFLIYALLGVSVLISLFGIVKHAAPVRLRAHARDRHAARDRHDTPPAAAHDPLRERDHGRDRQPARARDRHRLRLDRDEGSVQRRAGVRRPLGNADLLRGGRGPRRRTGGSVAGLARLAPAGSGGAQLRVAGGLRGVSVEKLRRLCH